MRIVKRLVVFIFALVLITEYLPTQFPKVSAEEKSSIKSIISMEQESVAGGGGDAGGRCGKVVFRTYRNLNYFW